MGRQTVASREYKVMLQPARFAGDEEALLTAARTVWGDFRRSIADIVLDTGGELGHIKARRLITFYDTANQHLNIGSYIFRDRRDIKARERQVTLKFRHPDRYVAENRNMKAAGPENARTKFEEDIKTPFLSLYSFSTTLKTGDDRTFSELGDISGLFPGIAERLDGFRESSVLAAVNGFTARELVIGRASLQIGKTPKVDAECALIVWYDHNRQLKKPVAVELSYRYGDKGGNYGGGMSRRAFEVLDAVQAKLGKWIDRSSRTKTAFVYG